MFTRRQVKERGDFLRRDVNGISGTTGKHNEKEQMCGERWSDREK